MQRVVTETVAGELYHYYPLGQHIVRAPGVCGGRPTFTYTRIEIAGTLDRIAAGEAILEALQLATTQFIGISNRVH